MKIVSAFLILGLPLASWSSVPAAKNLNALEFLREAQVETITNEQKENFKKYYGDYLKMAASNQQGMKVRWKALILAAKLDPSGSVQDVATFAKHEDWFMRNAALMALQETSPYEAQAVAKQLLKDKALVVRSAAVDVLTHSTAKESRDILWKELNQKYNFKGQQSLWIRPQIINHLVKSPRADELKYFSEALFDKDQQVSRSAMTAMENLTRQNFGRSPASLKTWQDYAQQKGLVIQ